MALDRWVRMSPKEYADYRDTDVRIKDAWDDGYNAGMVEGYESGYKDARRTYSPDDLEVENDENWND